MVREHIEQLLNSFIGKKIVIKMQSMYCSCLISMKLESVEFSQGVKKSKVSDSFIKYSSVCISDEKGRFTIEYEDVENIRYNDTSINQFYEFQLIYRDGTTVQFYSAESFKN
ncbi:hypothetical protein I6U48_11545 [Clostridium sp. PL3]|uniref:Uncharacterized protein n=1 Tax=Clostridium thailandense TaxID=2794346 RepID=A0A949X475_9CLOT|nr:hypothetical protein [Clostridium thailandense]MBV7273543.1 hypothetical protein [Clostridium thailandense]